MSLKTPPHSNNMKDISMNTTSAKPLNAFCVDLEEWFHICGVKAEYSHPNTWDSAPACVERDTEVLMELLSEAGCHGTFLTVGWVAEKYPNLIRRLSEAGHEIGCHGYTHQLIFQQSFKEFRQEIHKSRRILQDLSGQAVACFRAPGFSMKRECFWAYSILAEEGILVDVSIVPAARDHGGVDDFCRQPFELMTGGGRLKVFPVSVMEVMGKRTPFSGGGYLRLFPLRLIEWGFLQNHELGIPVMSYIHPREVNPKQPRLRGLPWKKRIKYYVGLNSTVSKLRGLLKRYPFGTVTDALSEVKQFPPYRLVDNDIVRDFYPSEKGISEIRQEEAQREMEGTPIR